jgi:acetyltransferase-like isoleucine patch superfamily enzyme
MRPFYTYLTYYNIRRLVWWLLNSHKFKKIGFGTRFYSVLKITPNFISCGRGVIVWKHGRIEGVGKYNNKFFNPEIVFHDYVTIQQNIHITCACSIIIGQNTAIAANVTITDMHHPYEDINIPIEKQDIRTSPVVVGADCKIYNNAVILPGTNIGKHCTIGANSVVSGTFPDFCVIAGTPAKVVKKYNFIKGRWEKTNHDGSFNTFEE